MSDPTALVILGNGFEEVEALTPVDLLRRAGVTCTVASREPTLLVDGRNGIKVQADELLEAQLGRSFDALVVPGGPGTAALRQDPRVLDLVRTHHSSGRTVAAICAAPTVLQAAGILGQKRYTGHSSIASELPNLQPEEVVVDGNIITSRGAGTSVPFALELVATLTSRMRAREIASSIHYGGW